MFVSATFLRRLMTNNNVMAFLYKKNKKIYTRNEYIWMHALGEESLKAMHTHLSKCIYIYSCVYSVVVY